MRDTLLKAHHNETMNQAALINIECQITVLHLYNKTYQSHRYNSNKLHLESNYCKCTYFYNSSAKVNFGLLLFLGMNSLRPKVSLHCFHNFEFCKSMVIRKRSQIKTHI